MHLQRHQESFSVRVATKRGGEAHIAGAGAQVPLRTRTVAAPRLRLETYHDSSAMHEAFERLKRSCGLSQLDEAEELSKLRGSSGPAALNSLPGHVLVHCFSFCCLGGLGALSGVSRRFAALAGARHLWAAHALRLRAPVRGADSARAELRDALAARRAAQHEEVARHEEVLAAIEQRLHARAAADMAEPIDVRTVLSTTAAVGMGSAPGALSTAVGGVGGAPGALGERVERLEAEQAELFGALREVRAALAEQQQRYEQQKQENLAEQQRRGEPLALTLAEVAAFERRICRVVLCAVGDLPVVLRRGVADFGTMEMLCRNGAGQAGDGARKRWAAFKRFFPLSDEYGAVRAALATCEEALAPAKVKEAAGRIGSVIRRVQQMTDNEIVQIVM